MMVNDGKMMVKMEANDSEMMVENYGEIMVKLW
jgi:nitrate reductase NapAB chaperone NapD